jgi:hypothetical protein
MQRRQQELKCDPRSVRQSNHPGIQSDYNTRIGFSAVFGGSAVNHLG